MKKPASVLLAAALATAFTFTPLSTSLTVNPTTVEASYRETAVNTKGYVTGISQLNVRKIPSSSATSLGKIVRDGTMMVRTSFTTNGARWYKIQWGTGYAYVPAAYVKLSTAEVAFTKATYVAPSSVYLKSRPLTTSPNVVFLRQGMKLETISYRYTGTTRWYKVRIGTKTGYILAKHITFKAPASGVLAETNEERQAAGLSALSASSEANRVAQVRADEMARTGQFSHQLRENGSLGNTLDAYNVSYRGWGENIYMGSSDPAQAVSAWMNSTGHRANILNENFTHLGVGAAKNAQGSTIHVQVFLTK
ncbi:CAP domain-containing protein [Exiguobacterium sp. s28]|uniref:CAP domain-containing protein n=1 Tax=Exiguobacterium sp. s28 TaxID=2751238 RepID=UPI0005144576|nr:CAP domain-containing protein [Exiguobacterium sp. s28]KGI86202.1 SCP-like extracellular family protein [Exiguobacterium mexicanum]